MGSVKIKICGITSARDADAALSEGVDLLGFRFLRGPRRADPRFVREIVRRLPQGAEAVGVFRNQPLEEVRSILAESDVPIAQLDGSEPPEFAAALGVRVIKTFTELTRASLQSLARYDSFAYLVDEPRGRALRPADLDWAVCAKKFGRVLVTAPGTPDALHEMIHRIRPWGVDDGTCAGAKPDSKDPVKIRALVHAVRLADHDTQKIRVTVR